MSNYKPVKGDRVRVVLEGEVKKVYSDGDLHIESVKYYETAVPREGIVSVEKIEPPVEVFKPGDVVRSIEYPKHVYTLGSGGYYSHRMEKFYEPGCAFTSAEYELVHRP